MGILSFMIADVITQPNNHWAVITIGCILTAYAIYSQE